MKNISSGVLGHEQRFSYPLDCKNSKAFWMENGIISDDQITASSQYDVRHCAANGRLNFIAGGGRRGSWSTRINDVNQWLIQVDFQRIITGISIPKDDKITTSLSKVTRFLLATMTLISIVIKPRKNSR